LGRGVSVYSMLSHLKRLAYGTTCYHVDMSTPRLAAMTHQKDVARKDATLKCAALKMAFLLVVPSLLFPSSAVCELLAPPSRDI